jgi:hypothetical protein
MGMKVLLVDTAFAAAPIYRYLVDAGHEVWVMGNRPQDQLAAKAGSKWLQQDYSRTDEVREHLRRLQIDCLVPGCTDVSIETCLELGADSGLVDSPQTNAILANKAAFRRLCIDLRLPAPQTVREADFPKPGRFICKPVDAFSGRGITVFDGMDSAGMQEACQAARRASPTANVLIETFEAGDLYSCSGFIEHQKLKQVFYVREGSSANPFAVDTSYVAWDLPRSCTDTLTTALESLSSALRLKDGLLHTQFIFADGAPFIVEVSRRCPGDLYPLLIEYSTGYPYAAKYASYFIGAKLSCGGAARRHVLRHTVASMDTVVYAGLKFRAAQSVLGYFPILQVGQMLLARQGSRAGILFTEAPTYEQLLADFSRYMTRDAYELA